jgi:hypothetical protein
VLHYQDAEGQVGTLPKLGHGRGRAMTQAALRLRQPLQWLSHPFWGHVSACRAYAIRQDQNGPERPIRGLDAQRGRTAHPEVPGACSRTFEQAEEACTRHAP